MAYYIPASKRKAKFEYFPFKTNLKSHENVIIKEYDAQIHEKQVYDMFKVEVDDGNSYPQDKMDTPEEFTNFYTSHNTFVCVLEASSNVEQVIGSFYVKPNYPGRCSHNCNSGFLVRQDYRGKGVGKILTYVSLRAAKDLGYESVLYNLVFITNKAAIKVYTDIGFKEVGIVPRAGNLKTFGYTDAKMLHYDLRDLDEAENMKKWRLFSENNETSNE